MNINRILLAKKDLHSYGPNAVDSIAKSLGIEATNYEDKLWLSTMKLHGQNKASMPGKEVLTDIDVWMAKFSWNANQMKGELSETETKTIEKLLDSYRKYIQNGEQYQFEMRTKINKLISVKNYSTNTPSERPLEIKVRMPPGRLNNGDDSELEDESTVDLPIHTMNSNATLTGKDRTMIRKQLQTQIDSAPKLEKEQAMKEFYNDSGKFKQESLTDAYKIMRQQQESFLSNLGEQLVNAQEQSKGSDEFIELNKRLIQIEELNVENAKMMKDLYSAQIQQQSLTEVAWYNLPKKIKLEFVKGFKRGMLYVAFAPITFPALITNNVIVKPMIEAYEYFSKYIRILWGTVLWVVCIGGVVHIYYSTDWSYVNGIMESSIVKGAYNYVTIAVNYGWEYLPASSAVLESQKKLWNDLGNTIIGTLIENISKIAEYLKNYIATALCAIIEHMSSSTWGYGFGTVSSYLCKAAIEEQSSGWWPF